MPIFGATASIEAGTVAYFAAANTPAGWLKANGAAISRTTYAKLFAAIGTTYGTGNGSTTFNLPDLRGEFVRGIDDGRGVDTNRTFGTHQPDEMRTHGHSAWTDTQGSHNHSANMHFWDTSVSTAFRAAGTGGGYTGKGYTDGAGAHAHNVGIGATGGTETRPRNLALLACIKY